MEQALTVLELYDEIRRDTRSALATIPAILKAFKEFARNCENCRIKWRDSLEENEELKEKLEKIAMENVELERKVFTSRKLLDEERAKRQRVAEERDQLEYQLDMVRDLLKDSRNKIHDDTKEKLDFLSRDFQSVDRLDTINELESTGSVLSELSYTRDEEDLNISSPKVRRSKRRQASNIGNEISSKRKRPSSKSQEISMKTSNFDKLIAKTTVTVEHTGPLSATSVIETIPQVPQIQEDYLPSAPPLSETESEEMVMNRPYGTPTTTHFDIVALNSRPHHFQTKAMIKGESCNVCSKRIKFSALGAKCADCKTVCHANCKLSVPLPCIPMGHTPTTSKGVMGTIADYTPTQPPLIPALVIHCVKEIEARGLTEVGIYRIPGSEKEVKNLKEKFLRGKGVPNLSLVNDIHVVCCCLKDFLRSLKDSLVTHIRWDEFVRASETRDLELRRSRLRQLIADLPRPNRDTLAFLLLHLQKVAESPECKMPISNLAKMFGPNLVGYSRNEPNDMIYESSQANRVVFELLEIPGEYWESFIVVSNINQEPNEMDMMKTPSTNSLMNFFSTPGRSGRPQKKTRYFESP